MQCVNQLWGKRGKVLVEERRIRVGSGREEHALRADPSGKIPRPDPLTPFGRNPDNLAWTEVQIEGALVD